MRRGPRNLRVAADGVGLTQFGGVALLEQFFQRIHLQGALWRHVRFAQRNNRYSISESLEALLYPLILGLGRIETTEPLRHNGVFHYLAGLPGYPDATTLRRFLDRFARRGRNSLVKLHDAWRAAMLGEPSQAVFDLDSTVLTVYGRQERAEVGYNPKKRGRPSYLPLLCFGGEDAGLLGRQLPSRRHSRLDHHDSFAGPRLRQVAQADPRSESSCRLRLLRSQNRANLSRENELFTPSWPGSPGR